MRSFSLFVAALSCVGIANAQQTAEFLPTDGMVRHSGTFYLETGEYVSNGSTAEANSCGEGIVYNNSADSGFFFNGQGASLVDTGQIPSTGPDTSYNIRGFEISYVSNQPTTDCTVNFWDLGAQCAGFTALGAPTAGFNITGLPGSGDGTAQIYTVFLDLGNFGLEFEMQGDSNGVAGDGDGDLFGWSCRYPQGLDGVSVVGPLLAKDPLACAEGAGIFADFLGCDGAGTGSGLGSTDAFVREADGLASLGCLFFGGYPNNPYASFHLKLSSSSDGDSCSQVIDLGSAIGTDIVSFDTTCNSTSGFDGGGSCSFGSTTIGADVFYLFTVPADGDYSFDTFGSSFDTKMSVHAGGDCAATCTDYNDDAGGLQSQVSVTGALAGDLLLIQIGGFGSSAGIGDLTIEQFVDPCAALMDDAFEDNDDQANGAAIGDASLIGLAIFDGDDDYFSTAICAGGTLTVDALFIDVDGDIDLRILDAAGSELDLSWTTTDNEQVTYTNASGAAIPVSIRVTLYAGDCTTYDLIIGGSCNVGTQTCVQNANSTGNAAQILIAGSAAAGANDLSLTASGMPAGEPGYFVWSTADGLVDLPAAGISDGFLCLGSGKGRFNGNVFTVGADGTGGLEGIDMTVMPQSSMGTINIMAGDTGYFQGWFRDGMSNNFTDAASITWQ
ncbi:MAG: hypothetical protein ACI8QC_003533 [Planctomycetota bacterium]|jgi:hypothetical protein